ncbi:MAG: peptidoglycan DD-metalloendopeptidase family protein [Longimicrobiales bacterium]|nr:peptidoglycan DD-metalloendopeptidase family protein [Longimicrobiales bacterium]
MQRRRGSRAAGGAAAEVRRALMGVVAGGALVLAVPGAGSGQGIAGPLDVTVPMPPTVANGTDGSAFLGYELHLTNYSARPWTLERVAVRVGEAPEPSLALLEGSELAGSLRYPGGRGQTGEVSPGVVAPVGPGAQVVVFLWLKADPERLGAADGLWHVITVAQSDSAGQTSRIEVPYGPVPLVRSLPVLGPPLRGGTWLAANGPSPTSGHGRALIPIGGSARIAQRFAVDYVRVDEQDRTFAGDRADNANYYAEDADALAVADGMVVAVKDSIPENVPGINSRAVAITLETVGGNYVILDIGDGLYAFYAHLRPGSLAVKVGDLVGRGDVLGKVGNSGNSTEPHLHLHLADAATPLGAEGLPYAHDQFELVGTCTALGGGCDRSGARTVRQAMPLRNDLIRFPG